MENDDLQILVDFFKVMADKTRLQIIGFISNDERRVSDLAELLDLKEPTISHHLARLRALGLVNLRVDGNNHFYRLNADQLESLSKSMFGLEQLNLRAVKEDKAWIDELDLSLDDRETLKTYIENNRIKTIPRKQAKLFAILRFLALQFEADRRYTERQVNEIILQFHDDYASLRRDLVDFKFLGREIGGSEYWLISTMPTL